MAELVDLYKATPGSALALEHGCTCPVGDNCRGAGYMGQEGEFWIAPTCPLHGDLGEDDDKHCHYTHYGDA